jgi:hypothetical protein
MIAFLLVAALSSIQDRPFLLIQETWIYNHTSKPNALTDVMSTRLATLIRDLGCNHYSCRENATELLLQQSNEDMIRALYWGSHHTDREIASRCRDALHTLMVCNHCTGRRDCPNRTDAAYSCVDCFNWMVRLRDVATDEMKWEIRNLYHERKCMFCCGVGIMDMDTFR